MKITIINGYDNNRNTGFLETVKSTITDEYSKFGYQVSYHDLSEKEIGACTGCQNCFIKTPGQCVLADDHGSLLQAFIQSDFVFWITPLAFGSYGSKVKRTIDRFMPLLMPSFEKVDGVHVYKKRYDQYPSNIVISILPEANKSDETIVFDLLDKNARSFGGEKNISVLLYEHQCDSEIQETLGRLTEDIGVNKSDG